MYGTNIYVHNLCVATQLRLETSHRFISRQSHIQPYTLRYTLLKYIHTGRQEGENGTFGRRSLGRRRGCGACGRGLGKRKRVRSVRAVSDSLLLNIHKYIHT